MKRSIALLALVALVSCKATPPVPAVSPEMAAWQQRAEGITIVLVTHEADVAAHAKRQVRFLDGEIVSDRLTSELQGHPA